MTYYLYKPLKNQIGSAFTDNLDFTIEKENIVYDDEREPHKIPMYKTMMQLYYSIIVKVVAAEDNLINKDKNKIVETDDNQIIETTIPKDKKIRRICNNLIFIDVPRIKLLYFPKSLKYSCFTESCKYNIQIFKNGKLLILCFNTGGRDITYPKLINDDSKFIEWLQLLCDIIRDNNCTQLLLCGHSNGMSSATIITFFLLCLKNKIFYEKYNKIIENELFTKLYELNLNLILQTIDIYLVGSAGFPVIFSNKDEFKLFYDELEGRYLHIGLTEPLTIEKLYDNFELHIMISRINSSINIINRLNIDLITRINEYINYINQRNIRYDTKIDEFSKNIDHFIYLLQRIILCINTEYMISFIHHKEYDTLYNNCMIFLNFIYKIKNFDSKYYNIDGYMAPYYDYKNNIIFNNYKFALYQYDYSTNNICYIKMINDKIDNMNYNDMYSTRIHGLLFYRDSLWSYLFNTLDRK
jgi:hypothetical protein